MQQRTTPPIKPCPEWLAKLNVLRPDDLSPQERMRLSKHLETCQRCQAVKTEYAAINALILNLPRARPLPTVPARLQDLIGEYTETELSLTTATAHGGDEVLPLRVPVHTTTTQRRNSSLTNRLNQVAAVLVVMILLCGLLLLFSVRKPGNVNTANNAAGLANSTRLYLITAGPDGQTNKVLSALNPATGHIIWQQALDNTLDGYGLSLKNNLYLTAQDGNVYAFRGQDGQPLWHTDMSHGSGFSISAWLLAYQNLVIDSLTNRTNDNGDLYALNAQTGDIVWHTAISCAASTSNDCAGGERITLLAHGIIYGLADDGLSAWNAANGHFLWRNPYYQANGQPQSMVVAQGKVYITNFSPRIDVLDASSGRFLHSLRPPEPTDSGVVYDIAAGENTVYVLGGQTVSAYRASDDTLLWKHLFSYHSNGTIYAANSGIYVNYYDISTRKGVAGGNLGSPLYVLRRADGHIIWHSQSPTAGSNLYPIEFNGVICIGGTGGIYGLRTGDGQQLWHIARFVDGYVAS